MLVKWLPFLNHGQNFVGPDTLSLFLKIHSLLFKWQKRELTQSLLRSYHVPDNMPGAKNAIEQDIVHDGNVKQEKWTRKPLLFSVGWS